MRVRSIAAALLVAATACSKKEPEAKPTPVAVQIAQQAMAHMDSLPPGATVIGTIIFVEPSETDYVNMIVAAAGWAKRSQGRTIGVLQQTNGHALWQRATEAASQRYALRPIQLSDYSVVCGQPERQQTSITQQKAICTMKFVDAVLQFNSVRMTRDSGYVTVGVTRVPTGGTKSETVYNCVTLARKGPEWDARRSERVLDIHRCPRGIP